MWSWWREAAHLPFPKGPYIPGCIDVMTDYSPSGSFVRLYYPTPLTDIKSHSSKWINWLEQGRYLDGFSRFLQCWAPLFKLSYSLVIGNPQVPAVWGAAPCEGGQFPVIVLSHGLGASRFTFSVTSLELASHGFFVAVLEHRDGTACASFYYESEEDQRNNHPTWIMHKKMDERKKQYPVRNQQVHQRAVECQKALDLLEQMNRGDLIHNVLNNGFPLECFKGRLQVESPFIMGHSFGGATTLLTLGLEPRFKVGIGLDVWMFPIKDEGELPHNIKQPLLLINTDTFHTPANLKAMKPFLTGPNGAYRRLVTVKGTSHDNQSDVTILTKGWFQRWSGAYTDAYTAMDINNNLVINFLQNYVALPHNPSFDGFLETHKELLVDGINLEESPTP